MNAGIAVISRTRFTPCFKGFFEDRTKIFDCAFAIASR